MIGHAHIDPVWRWTKDEGYQEVFATFRSALDRMKEFPEVMFVSSSAQFYEWVAQGDPAMFEEIKQRVNEGRWNIVGGWWIEPDVNCPSGESLLRQGLYGQRFFQQHFGRKARIGFNPDTFGHPWTLPQILRQQGLEAYFFMRPELNEMPTLPAPIFHWQGADGTSLLAVTILSSYGGGENSIDGRVKLYRERFAKYLPEVKDFSLFYGIGNHGGGPTIAAIKAIKKASQSKYPGMKFSTLEQYVDLLRPLERGFPTVQNELQHHARGCYSACANVKLWNRQAETALLQAEKLSSLTSVLLGNTYPAAELQKSWKKVLFNQFHDIMAGSSIEEGYVDAERDYGYALSVAREASIQSLHLLGYNVQTADSAYEPCRPFIVFNPCSWKVTEPIEFEVERARRNVKPVLRDAAGKAIPYQEIRTAGVKVSGRIRVAFRAQVPSLGYQLYRLDFSGKEEPAQPASVKAGKDLLENELVRVTFDTTTGYIASYFDKKNNRELLRRPAAVPIVLNDWDDTWGHKIVAYDREVGRFSSAVVNVMEEGPERARLQVKSHYGNSFIVQDFALHSGSAALDCKVTVDWHELARVLKLGFPTVLSEGRLTYSIPYGFIERAMNGDEEPGQTWIDLSGSDSQGTFGFALLNDSKCGYSAKDGELRLTVLHSTAWSHHNPAVVSEKDGYRYMEQGIHEFSYRLLPHEGDWKAGDVARKAESFLSRPQALVAASHSGKLPASEALVSVSTENVAVSVAKMAEDGKALVLRCVELYGQEANGKIHVKPLGKEIDLKMRPCEIKTFWVPMEKGKQVKVVNALEE